VNIYSILDDYTILYASMIQKRVPLDQAKMTEIVPNGTSSPLKTKSFEIMVFVMD